MGATSLEKVGVASGLVRALGIAVRADAMKASAATYVSRVLIINRRSFLQAGFAPYQRRSLLPRGVYHRELAGGFEIQASGRSMGAVMIIPNRFSESSDSDKQMTETQPPSEELIRMLSHYDLKVGELALELRSMVLTEAPAAVEKLLEVYALVFWYSLTGKMTNAFCQVVVYAKGVNLMFNRGAELEDPDGVLVGEGKIIRHIKVRRPEDLKNPHLRKFIRAAIKHAKSLAREKELAGGSTKPRPSARSRPRR